jgi:hypothetical protein
MTVRWSTRDAARPEGSATFVRGLEAAGHWLGAAEKSTSFHNTAEVSGVSKAAQYDDLLVGWTESTFSGKTQRGIFGAVD